MANKATELRLMQIFRANGITGWRRGCALRIGSGVRDLASGVQTQRPKTPDPKSKIRATRSTGRAKPDFVFQKLKMALFVDGCFWHGCPKHGTKPKTNAKFWRDKIAGNMARDRRVNDALRKRGWTVLRVWQHELSRKDEATLLKKLGRFI